MEQGRGLWVPTQDGLVNSGRVCASVSVPLLCDFAWLSTLPLRVLLYLKIWNGHICPAYFTAASQGDLPWPMLPAGKAAEHRWIEWV